MRTLERFLLCVVGIGFLWLIGINLPSDQYDRVDGRYHICQNNLKLIGLALQNYYDKYGSFPPAFIADAHGKRLHSWRALLLEEIEPALYKEYRFDEPWNGPHNSKLHSRMVRWYACPQGDGTKLAYLAVVGPNTVWPGSIGRKLNEVTDGNENTIAVVEQLNSKIHWMEPRDLEFGEMSFRINDPQGNGMSGNHQEDKGTFFSSTQRHVHALLVDGSVKEIPEVTPPQTIQAMLTVDAGEPLPKLP